mmetsp:Transcript_17371/g.24349  ORF Transcript_17371/g.24349 Transcript_17371/m.24349 type:complete len:93 (-) Transcript_17371:209-487(-)
MALYSLMSEYMGTTVTMKTDFIALVEKLWLKVLRLKVDGYKKCWLYIKKKRKKEAHHRAIGKQPLANIEAQVFELLPAPRHHLCPQARLQAS